MESWRHVWRVGFQPLISTAGLRALAEALRQDYLRLKQGCTTDPVPMHYVRDWPCQGACAVSYCGWQNGQGIETVGEVEEYFADLCFRADQALGELRACRWFLNWFDETPRAEAFRELLAEVDTELMRRQTTETIVVDVEAMYRVNGEPVG